MDYRGGRKRGRHENSNDGFKKSKQEMESLSTGVGSKLKPCTKFFSTSGCSFGDECHFLHYVPGGLKAASHMLNIPHPQPSRSRGVAPSSSFGASATAKISIDASLAGAIIGRNGLNTKQICRVTGAKLSIRDNEMDPSLRNIELEGSFDQIDRASTMVRELIANLSQGNAHGPPVRHVGGHGSVASNFKTKLCERFSVGSCTFGDRCHFAHGTQELRKSVM